MFEKILVPLDGSKNAEMVIPYVEEIAGKFNSEVTLISVTGMSTLRKKSLSQSSSSPGRDTLLRLYLEDITKQILSQSKDYGLNEKSHINSKILYGKVAQEILSYANASNAGLVAMTSQGSSAEAQWVLGNISAKVVRATRKPVLLVRTKAEEAALTQKRLVKKILVPLDGSKLGEAAIPLAETLAKELDAQLVLVRVTEPLINWGIYDANPANPPTETIESRNSHAERYLSSVVDSIRKRQGIVAFSVVLFGLPAREIVSYAEGSDVSLIAMSTHGRSGIGQWVFGSVTDKVLHAGDTPVLVVRPPGA